MFLNHHDSMRICLFYQKKRLRWRTERKLEWKLVWELPPYATYSAFLWFKCSCITHINLGGEKVLSGRRRDKPLCVQGADHSQTGQGVCYSNRDLVETVCVRLRGRRRVYVCVCVCVCLSRHKSRQCVCSHRYNRLSVRWTYLVGTSLQGMA